MTLTKFCQKTKIEGQGKELNSIQSINSRKRIVTTVLSVLWKITLNFIMAKLLSTTQLNIWGDFFSWQCWIVFLCLISLLSYSSMTTSPILKSVYANILCYVCCPFYAQLLTLINLILLYCFRY